MKLSLSWFQLFPFICKLIWKVLSFSLLLSLTCVTAIGLFKIDRVTIGARPHNFHLEISFNFKVFVQLLKQICQNHEIYLVVKQLTVSQNWTEASNVSPWALYHFQAILQHQLNFYSSKIASLCDNQQLISSKYAQGISFHVQSWSMADPDVK